MHLFRIYFLLLLFILSGCEQKTTSRLPDSYHLMPSKIYGQEALLLTRFESFNELDSLIEIQYYKGFGITNKFFHSKSQVHLKHLCGTTEVTSILKKGVSEKDFLRVQDGGLWDRIWLVINSPYAVLKRKDLRRMFALSRRRDEIFGEGDVAFFDLAEQMAENISEKEKIDMSAEDLSEKGYLNTFNHITAQALMTSICSEKLADFIADTHERRHMPELISGNFTNEQLEDITNGPTDNYVDMINNEWGQEIGKLLRVKYSINHRTDWTNELLANYLNDIQIHCSWAFQIRFEPFRPADELIKRFSAKINQVNEEVPLVR